MVIERAIVSRKSDLQKLKKTLSNAEKMEERRIKSLEENIKAVKERLDSLDEMAKRLAPRGLSVPVHVVLNYQEDLRMLERRLEEAKKSRDEGAWVNWLKDRVTLLKSEIKKLEGS